MCVDIEIWLLTAYDYNIIGKYTQCSKSQVSLSHSYIPAAHSALSNKHIHAHEEQYTKITGKLTEIRLLATTIGRRPLEVTMLITALGW